MATLCWALSLADIVDPLRILVENDSILDKFYPSVNFTPTFTARLLARTHR